MKNFYAFKNKNYKKKILFFLLLFTKCSTCCICTVEIVIYIKYPKNIYNKYLTNDSILIKINFKIVNESLNKHEKEENLFSKSNEMFQST